MVENKKRMLLFLIIMIFLAPLLVNANIICNDGTTSPRCKDCHRGCCSRHGGCTENSSSYHRSEKYINDSNDNQEQIIDDNDNYNSMSFDEYIKEKGENIEKEEPYENDNTISPLEIVVFILFFIIPLGAVGLTVIQIIIEKIKEKKTKARLNLVRSMLVQVLLI